VGAPVSCPRGLCRSSHGSRPPLPSNVARVSRNRADQFRLPVGSVQAAALPLAVHTEHQFGADAGHGLQANGTGGATRELQLRRDGACCVGGGTGVRCVA
jgi:hypothetical protein